jgi:predicted alpha/beta superfamily hydrolase
MKVIARRLPLIALLPIFLIFIAAAAAQDIAPPIPQKLVVHSNILGEDRVIWVRTPHGYELGKDVFPVLYLTDGDGHINEIGSTIDFLVDNGRMPPLIVVGIANTDRTRDLTPTHSSDKDSSGKEALPTSGGGDRFFDFIQSELMPAIDKRYRTAPYRIFAGHSLGGLMAIHILTSRPDMFQAYLAVSPSLWWDHQHTLHQAQDFFAAHDELDKTLFFSLGGEGPDMQDGFDQLNKALSARSPKGFHWDSARYSDETHSSTVLRAHYAGLRSIFAAWEMPRDDKGMPVGGMSGIDQHYHEVSARLGYPVPVPENLINGLGYRLLGDKKIDEAIAAFQRNVQLYPSSANVYDSLADGYEGAGRLDLALQNCEKAVEVGTKTNDGNLDGFKDHLKRVSAASKATAGKTAPQK